MSGKAKIQQIVVLDTNKEYVQRLRLWLESEPISLRMLANPSLLHKEIKKPIVPDLLLVADSLVDDVQHIIHSDADINFNRPVIAMIKHENYGMHRQLLDMGVSDVISKDMPGDLVVSILKRRIEDYQHYIQLPHVQEHRLEFGELVVDNLVREAWLDNQQIELTGAEFDLLWLLCSHAGQIMTREEIFYRLRGIEYDGQDRSVDVRVSRIRPKVGDDPDHPRRIKTIRSKGYLFVPDADVLSHINKLSIGSRLRH